MGVPRPEQPPGRPARTMTERTIEHCPECGRTTTNPGLCDTCLDQRNQPHHARRGHHRALILTSPLLIGLLILSAWIIWEMLAFTGRLLPVLTGLQTAFITGLLGLCTWALGVSSLLMFIVKHRPAALILLALCIACALVTYGTLRPL